MRARDRLALAWLVVASVVGVVVGWWLAMRTVAAKLVSSAAVVVEPAALEPGEPVEAVQAPTRIPLSKRAEDYLTVKEVAEYLRLSEKSVRRELDDGRLPFTKMRGKVTVKGSDVLAWLSARREA